MCPITKLFWINVILLLTCAKIDDCLLNGKLAEKPYVSFMAGWTFVSAFSVPVWLIYIVVTYMKGA